MVSLHRDKISVLSDGSVELDGEVLIPFILDYFEFRTVNSQKYYQLTIQRRKLSQILI